MMTTTWKWGILGLAAVVAFIGWAQPNLNICDYERPETHIRSAHVGFEYTHEDDPRTAGVDSSSGELRLNISELADTRLLGYSLTGQGTFGLRVLQLTQVLMEISGNLRRYILPESSWFAFGGTRFRLDSAKPQPGLSFQAGLGYGRFKDVTPLVKAKEIENWLLGRGILVTALRNEALLTIAREIERAEEYATVADQVQALVALVEAESGRKLDCYAVLMIEQLLTRFEVQRYCGWTVRWGLDYTLLEPMQRPAQLALLVTGEMALALPPSHQLRLQGTLSGPYYIWEHYDLELTGALDYRLNRTVAFTVNYELKLYKRPGQAPMGEQSAAFDLRFALGPTSVVLQVVFAKVAEVEAWTQKIRLAVEAQLW